MLQVARHHTGVRKSVSEQICTISEAGLIINKARLPTLCTPHEISIVGTLHVPVAVRDAYKLASCRRGTCKAQAQSCGALTCAPHTRRTAND